MGLRVIGRRKTSGEACGKKEMKDWKYIPRVLGSESDEYSGAWLADGFDMKSCRGTWIGTIS